MERNTRSKIDGDLTKTKTKSVAPSAHDLDGVLYNCPAKKCPTSCPSMESSRQEGENEWLLRALVTSPENITGVSFCAIFSHSLPLRLFGISSLSTSSPACSRWSKGDRPVHGNAMASEKRYGSPLARWKMHLERKIVRRLRGCWKGKQLFTFGVFYRENVNRESKAKKDTEWRYRNIAGAIFEISTGVRYKRVNMNDVGAACSWIAEIIAYCSRIRRKPHHMSHASSASQMSSHNELVLIFILFFFILASFAENRMPIMHFEIF